MSAVNARAGAKAKAKAKGRHVAFAATAETAGEPPAPAALAAADAARRRRPPTAEPLQRLSRVSLSRPGGCADRGPDASEGTFEERRRRVSVADGPVNFQHSFVKENPGKLADFYDIPWSSKLGAGAFGTVRKGSCRRTAQMRAIKSVNTEKLEEPARLEAEIEIARHLHHPNVVRLFETFREQGQIHLVMELCAGGELFDKLSNEYPTGLPEARAIEYTRQMFFAVAYCHGQYIAHRDLKPENFLLSGPEPNAPLKLADFGGAQCFVPGGDPMRTALGTAYYIAPEVLKGSYNELCDVWSAGVVTYVLLSGCPPFQGSSIPNILKKVLRAKVQFPATEWEDVSGCAKTFIRDLLVADPARRPSAKAVLGKLWLRASKTESRLSSEVVERLVEFQKKKALKQAAVTAVAQYLPDDEVQVWRAAFKALDVNGDGVISLEELRQGLERHGLHAPPSLAKAIRAADSDGSGTLDYTEFLAATCDQRLYNRPEMCRAAFHALDLDGDGQISRADLRGALGGGDESLSPADGKIRRMLKEVDQDGDGVVDFQEFCAMMRPTRAQGSIMKGIARISNAWAIKTKRIDGPSSCISPVWRAMSRSMKAICRGGLFKQRSGSGGFTPGGERRKGRQMPTRRDTWKSAGG